MLLNSAASIGRDPGSTISRQAVGSLPDHFRKHIHGKADGAEFQSRQARLGHGLPAQRLGGMGP
jgi:hypothetical protein